MAPLGGSDVLFGGVGSGSGSGGGVLADTWSFDGTSWSSEQVPSHPQARLQASMTAVP
jgi:hypothetical protein